MQTVIVALVASGCAGAASTAPRTPAPSPSGEPTTPSPAVTPPTATAPTSQTTAPAPAPTPDPIRAIPRNAHPGFDTRRYPGDAALRAWAAHSPYEWVGYYLVAPCQTGPSWVGKRNTLKEIGFGTAVVFIGEQDWAGPPSDTGAAAMSGGKQCTVANLTAEKAAIDAARADSTAAGEGFPNGTTVFLDIEYVQTLSPRFSTYIGAWVRSMLKSGRYVPGVYVHRRNAEAVRAVAAAEYAAAGRTDAVPVWLAAPVGSVTASFNLDTSTPATSGFGFAGIWQGIFNVSETWGGVTLLIDVNLATGRDPSSGG